MSKLLYMNSIEDLSDEELYSLINLKSHNELSDDDIKYMINLIQDTVEEIKKEKDSKN